MQLPFDAFLPSLRPWRGTPSMPSSAIKMQHLLNSLRWTPASRSSHTSFTDSATSLSVCSWHHPLQATFSNGHLLAPGRSIHKVFNHSLTKLFLCFRSPLFEGNFALEDRLAVKYNVWRDLTCQLCSTAFLRKVYVHVYCRQQEHILHFCGLHHGAAWHVNEDWHLVNITHTGEDAAFSCRSWIRCCWNSTSGSSYSGGRTWDITLWRWSEGLLCSTNFYSKVCLWDAKFHLAGPTVGVSPARLCALLFHIKPQLPLQGTAPSSCWVAKSMLLPKIGKKCAPLSFQTSAVLHIGVES